jgi:hypothetical protein
MLTRFADTLLFIVHLCLFAPNMHTFSSRNLSFKLFALFSLFIYFAVIAGPPSRFADHRRLLPLLVAASPLLSMPLPTRKPSLASFSSHFKPCRENSRSLTRPHCLSRTRGWIMLPNARLPSTNRYVDIVWNYVCAFSFRGVRGRSLVPPFLVLALYCMNDNI